MTSLLGAARKLVQKETPSCFTRHRLKLAVVKNGRIGEVAIYRADEALHSAPDAINRGERGLRGGKNKNKTIVAKSGSLGRRFNLLPRSLHAKSMSTRFHRETEVRTPSDIGYTMPHAKATQEEWTESRIIS